MTAPARRKMTARERTRHILRIIVSVVAVVVYVPILAWGEVAIVGGPDLQEMFDWIMGRCAGCVVQQQLVTLVVSGVIALTLPVLAFGLYIWIRRANRSDRQVTGAAQYFRTAPERVPPATVGVDPVERRFYRDRQGRLRPMEPE